jgi:hypothetical protein
VVFQSAFLPVLLAQLRVKNRLKKAIHPRPQGARFSRQISIKLIVTNEQWQGLQA